jgi:diguanylate cyclase (GGDEF)-like protein
MDAASAVWSEVVSLMLTVGAAIMWAIWFIDRKRTYLLVLGVALTMAAFSFLAVHLPIALGYRVALTAVVFIMGVTLAQDAIVRRTADQRTPLIPAAIAAIGIFSVLGLATNGRQLSSEVHVQDVTSAAIGLCTVYRGRLMTSGRRGDRFLALVVVAGCMYLLVRSWLGLDNDALQSGQLAGFAIFTPPFVIGWVVLVIILVATLAAQELWSHIESLRAERDTDPLTEVLNRRGFQASVERLLSSGGRASSSLVIFDLDHFKPVNDRLGHGVGDDLLRNFAAVLRSIVRESDVVGRLGGDEFVVFLSGASYADALHVAQRIRRGLAQAPFNDFAGMGSITVSFGIATTRPGIGFAGMVAAADDELRRAKKRGPNGASHTVPN